MINKKDYALIKANIKDVPNFPKMGIMFRDCTPLLLNNRAFKVCINNLANLVKDLDFDMIVAPESRGFWFGISLANKLNKPFAPVRKPKKLPRPTAGVNYELEYGMDRLEIHKDDIKPGTKVLIIDDVLATGGTIEAIVKLIRSLDANVEGCLFLAALKDLSGKQKLDTLKVKANYLIEL